MCENEFKKAISHRIEHSNGTFAQFLPRILCDAYNTKRPGLINLDFTFLRIINFIQIASKEPECDEEDFDLCLDSLVKERDEPIRQDDQLRRLYTELQKTNVNVSWCFTHREECRLKYSGHRKKWGPDAAGKEELRQQINEWMILTVLSRANFFRNNTCMQSPDVKDERNTHSLDAMRIKAMQKNSKLPEEIGKLLSELRLLQPGGKLLFGFNEANLREFDRTCANNLVAVYTIILSKAVTWGQFMDAFRKMKNADKDICEFRKIQEALSEKHIVAQQKDLILPIWTFNRFCIFSSTSDPSCKELIVASVVAERFVTVYDVEYDESNPYKRE